MSAKGALFGWAAVCLAGLGGGQASAALIFDTGDPEGGSFGFIGDDVSQAQSVAVAFTPSETYTLDQLGVWMMSNDFDAPGRTFNLSLRTDAAGAGPTLPGGVVLESWSIATSAVGWQPVLETAVSSLHPMLSAGSTYWIVAESSEPAGISPVWVWGSTLDPVNIALIDFGSSPDWFGGTVQGSAPGARVYATLVPAPGAAGLLAMAGIGAMRRRRR